MRKLQTVLLALAVGTVAAAVWAGGASAAGLHGVVLAVEDGDGSSHQGPGSGNDGSGHDGGRDGGDNGGSHSGPGG